MIDFLKEYRGTESCEKTQKRKKVDRETVSFRTICIASVSDKISEVPEKSPTNDDSPGKL